ncbi:tRNA pseudouridine synthase 3 [Terramyces sp. JEL0728]|nr:tRNA pseudouridine synthase 3 [Terramyces sp. JEL0728]
MNLTKEQLIAKLAALEQPKKIKQQKPFQFEKTRARHVAFKVAYLGQNYFGFTGTMNEPLPTIEKELFKALTTCKLIPAPDSCGWSRAGRTDKGVSGFGQVVSLWVRTLSSAPFTLDWESVKNLRDPIDIDGEETGDELPYLSMINKLLPREIKVLAWAPVPLSFDARFSCQYRKYKYFFPTKGYDIDSMKKAAQYFVGTRDCRHICKLDSSKVERPEFFTRTIYEADIEQASDNFSVFIVKGRAFLWHQVRNMMALLFMVGKGSEKPEIIQTLLDLKQHPEKSGKPNYDMAPDVPLVLLDCGYGSINWLISDSRDCVNQQKVFQEINEQLYEAELKVLQLNTLKEEYKLLGAVEGGVEKLKQHIPLMKRKRCESLEVMVEKIQTKRGNK